jgi:hypothetical protein
MIDLVIVVVVLSACLYIGCWADFPERVYRRIDLRKRLAASRPGGSITYTNAASRVYLARKLAELVSPRRPDEEFYRICRKYDVSLHEPL